MSGSASEWTERISPGIRILHYLFVIDGFNLKLVSISDGRWRHQGWADRAGAVKSYCLHLSVPLLGGFKKH